MYLGWTSLKFASLAGHHGVVRFLVENGADINAKDILGNIFIAHDLMIYLSICQFICLTINKSNMLK